MKKAITLLYALSIYISLSAQEKNVLLHEQDGISISYILQFKKAKKKSDLYQLIVITENKSNFDYYYTVPQVIDKYGGYRPTSALKETSIAIIEIKNATMFFTGRGYAKGIKTDLVTKDNSALFELQKGKKYTYSLNFRIRTGVTPEIGMMSINPFRVLSSFALKPTLNDYIGNYQSNCNTNGISLQITKDKDRGTYLTQTTNTSKSIWLKENDTSFYKESNPDFKLNYNEDDNTFLYTMPDGNYCVWKKI